MNGMTVEQFKDTFCYHYVGYVENPEGDVHDGDTFTAVLDLGVYTKNHKFTIRPVGYNSPEVVGKERADGLEAKQFLIDLFNEIKTIHGQATFVAKTIKTKDGEKRSGTRYVAHVWVPNPNGELVDLWKLMVSAGFGEVSTR